MEIVGNFLFFFSCNLNTQNSTKNLRQNWTKSDTLNYSHKFYIPVIKIKSYFTIFMTSILK